MNKAVYTILTVILFICSCTKKVKEETKISNAIVSIRPLASNSASLEPVVFSTSLNFRPSELVAFKSDDGLSLVQIPVQVDERAMIDVTKPYGEPPSGYLVMMYTDANWHTGADNNTLIDVDDEIAFMLKDAGTQYTGEDYPSGTIAGTKKEVSITDGTGTYYVYLFKQNGTLQQNAGINYVQYSYAPTNSVFNYGNKRNNENSFVTTSKYKWHFAAEWISDQLVLGGVDILDRHKSFFGDGNCKRSENTFSDSRNAFVCNRSGAIRTIRSYMGANSGPLTQRTNIFYESRQDIITDLRVHSIPAINDVFDYSPAANGMQYTNSLNSAPKIIDGVNETVVKGDIQWELVTGSVGSLVILHSRQTTFISNEATYSSYWNDSSTNPASNCTGDGQAWGTSGLNAIFNNSALFTDPYNGKYTSPNFRTLKSTRIVYFEQPNLTNETATTYNNKQPLIVTWQ